MRQLLLSLTLILTFMVSLPARPVTAAPALSQPLGSVYFPETGHNIALQIKRFFDANGGVAIFGMPLTELIIGNDGLQVQYFENARLEYRPGMPLDQQITITRGGALFSANRTDGPFQWLGASPDPVRSFFPESGHTLGGAFGWFWQNHGGLPIFGYPISEEFYEWEPSANAEQLVQYFERARLIYNPAQAGTPNEVTLMPLGRWLLAQDPIATAASAPVAPLSLLGHATTGFPASSYERVTNISRATQMIDGMIVPAGAEFSFAGVGDFSEANGFVEGYAIVGGRLERVIGGGLCQVSTTLFRAVSNAGLQVTRRVGHSHIVNFYENILGFDATVFTPEVDFRWRNDSPGPVYIIGTIDLAAAQVTFELYGSSDGRSVTYQGPATKNWTKPGSPVWQYDSSLPAGAVRQMVHGRSGVDVTYTRIITRADGSRRVEPFFTRYTPWEDFYVYGPGVTPPGGARVIAPKR